MTKQTYDRVCHYEDGGSDKVYIVSVRKGKKGEWQVIGQWGRRGKNLRSQVKGEYLSRTSAHRQQDVFFRERLKKGYVDIKDQAYFGLLSMSDSWLQQFLWSDEKEDAQEPLVVVDPHPDPHPPAPDLMFEVVCANNLGVEDVFDQGIEYMAEKHNELGMLWVYDKFGKRREMFAERFKAQENKNETARI